MNVSAQISPGGESNTAVPADSLSGLSSLRHLSLLPFERPNYQRIWDLQKSLVQEIADGRHPESIIFCEHERVITCGRRAQASNILNASISQFKIERGGDVTMHNPGQLVIYPLIKLHGGVFRGGLLEYLRACEEVIIGVLKSYGLDAGRYGPTGVWIKRKTANGIAGEVKKIASIGVAVRRWITYHGISLNISNDLSDFDSIRPCDFESSIMTSLAEEGIHKSLFEVESEIYSRFCNILGE